MAKLLTLLFEVTALFDMTTRIELVMLQKTMVVVEGVARKLDPQLDMWATAEPVVGGWIARKSRAARPARRPRAQACRSSPSSSPRRRRGSSGSARTDRASAERDAGPRSRSAAGRQC